MANLYINLEPTKITCLQGSTWFHNGGEELRTAFFVKAADVSEVPIEAIKITHRGNCWRVLEKTYFSSGTRAGLICTQCNEEPVGKKLLLREMLSG